MDKTADVAQLYTVKHRIRFSIDNQALLGILLLGILVLIIIIFLFMFVQLSTRTLPLHFKANDQMQIIPPVPLDQEGISKASLLNWVNSIMMEAFSFNYSNQDKQAGKLAPYFTDDAMKQYLDIINNDDDFKTVKTDYYVVSAVATSTPEILTSKAAKGRYAWQIQLPARITLSNAKFTKVQEVTFEFFVWRVTELEAPQGVILGSFDHQITNRYQKKSFRTG
jgi:hypothetical protein